jgi:diaminopimelate decarboxylase
VNSSRAAGGRRSEEDDLRRRRQDRPGDRRRHQRRHRRVQPRVEEEIENVDRVAGSIGKQAIGAIRINPDVDPKTHAKTTTGKKETKFGVDIERAERVFEQYRGLKNLRIAGVHIHIGSPIYDIEPYVDAVKKMTALIRPLDRARSQIEWFDVGGWFGVNYERPDQAHPVDRITPRRSCRCSRANRTASHSSRAATSAGNSGVLLTRVLYRKTGGEKKFVIVDAGMNDLIRRRCTRAITTSGRQAARGGERQRDRRRDFQIRGGETVDVVGPICESGDYLAKGRDLPHVERGDLLAIFTAGAYGFAMSSNYNNRPRVPEVLVDGSSYKVIRKRETLEDLVALERV